MMLVVFGVGAVVLEVSCAARLSSKPSYFKNDLFELCPPDGGKKEINLRTTSAIFTLQVQ